MCIFLKVNWMKSLPSLEVNKKLIFEAMEETYHIRRNFIVKRKPSMAEILEEFPKLKDFNGALVSIAHISVSCFSTNHLPGN